ncbi:MAG: Ig domain-containing protein [Pyrinomonadaceae bacterium]
MRLKLILLLTTLWFLGVGEPTARSQQAIFAMPDGVVGLPYNQRVPDVLRTNYRRELISEGGGIEWSSLRALPAGLAIDADGTIYGTPQTPRRFTFRVQAVDSAHPKNGPTSLTLSLTVLNEGQSASGSGGPILRPIRVVTPPPSEGVSSTGVQVDVGGFEPSKSLVLPLVVSSLSGVQLEAIVFDKDSKPLRSAFTDQLPAGDVRTTVKLELEVGRNLVSIRDSATGTKYKSLTVDVPKTISTTRAVPLEGEPETSGEIELKHEGTVAKDATTTKITVHVEKPKIRKVEITVTPAKDGDGHATSSTFPIEDKRQDYEVPVMLAAGDSKVTARDADDEKAKTASLIIKRKTEAAKKFKVRYSQLVDKASLTTPLTVMVLDPDIAKLKVMITEKGKEEVLHNYVVPCAKANVECPLEVALPDGKNGTAYLIDITREEDPDAFGLATFESSTNAKEIIDFVRKGDSAVSSIPLNSLNTRAIVGFEQVGASASDSSSKPFLDFFFTAPLWFKQESDELSRLSLWGNIRLAAVPSQVTTLGVLPTTFVNQVSDGKLSELIQGFDFNVGPEMRLHSTKSFFSLIPGVKQRIDVYLAGGFGAISPLNPKQRENVQIFTVPLTTSPQYEEFKSRFPEAAASGKPYVAFTFPERDRFLRQYYAGLRFKTHFSNGGGIINRFPAIFDLMVGRNEAVTGGKLEHAVLRMEGFYPLPIKNADFLYIYGTAMMKLGGGGVKITKPIFLDTPGSTVGLSSPDLFIVPNRQNNSDYYRVGVGVDLTKLFNRKPKG